VAAAAPQQREILVFALGPARYALALDAVRELVRAVALVPLPGAPPIVEGVVNLRGQVVPVLDIRGRFGLPPRPVEPTDHLIVASAGGRVVAIRVDRALHLLTLEQALDPSVPSSGYVAGVARLADGLAVIHDLETFLSAPEGAHLDRALESAAGAPA
jgi:purine-binding chemotaxis protein CheW